VWGVGPVVQVHQHAFPPAVGVADPAAPWEQRNLALEHHQASFQEQAAAGNQIQAAEE